MFTFRRRQPVFVVVIPSTSDGFTVTIKKNVEPTTLPSVEVLHEQRAIFSRIRSRPLCELFPGAQKLIRGDEREMEFVCERVDEILT